MRPLYFSLGPRHNRLHPMHSQHCYILHRIYHRDNVLYKIQVSRIVQHQNRSRIHQKDILLHCKSNQFKQYKIRIKIKVKKSKLVDIESISTITYIHFQRNVKRANWIAFMIAKDVRTITRRRAFFEWLCSRTAITTIIVANKIIANGITDSIFSFFCTIIFNTNFIFEDVSPVELFQIHLILAIFPGKSSLASASICIHAINASTTI